jgi:hypothetical protein
MSVSSRNDRSIGLPREDRLAFSPVWVVPAAALIIALLYGRCVRFPFFYDDLFLLRPLSQWSFLGLSPMGDYWRPLWTLWMSIEYQLFGLHPGIMHLLSLGLHAVNCWLVVSLVGRQAGWRIAWATVVVWTLLCGNAYPIVWISACNDLFAMLFLLLATRVWIGSGGATPSLGRAAAASLLWLTSMLFKEVSLVWPVAALAYWAWRRRGIGGTHPQASRLALVLPLLALSAYAVGRRLALGQTAGFSALSRSNLRTVSLPILLASRVVHYFEALLYHVLPLDQFQTWGGLVAGTVLAAAFVVVLLATWRVAPAPARPWLAWSVVWILAFSLHGTFNPLPRGLYIPSLGTAAVIGILFSTSDLFSRWLPRAALGAYLLMHSYLGQEAADYHSEASLSTRMHAAQLLVGNDALMKPDTITPDKAAYLRDFLRYQDVAALSRWKEKDPVWRSTLRRLFARVSGRDRG